MHSAEIDVSFAAIVIHFSMNYYSTSRLCLYLSYSHTRKPSILMKDDHIYINTVYMVIYGHSSSHSRHALSRNTIFGCV